MRKLLLALTAILFFAGESFAQKSVAGKVTDVNGNPIANVSVLLKGTNTGTTTKADGTFSLTVPSTAKELVFTSVDMAPETVVIGSQSVINITMKTQEKVISEVIVVAYGTQKKADLTGSVATVKGSDIENKPFTSIDKALQGQVAGLQSVAASGAPGANQIIRIRGISSISASNAPLWVIDGVPVLSNDVSRLTTTANILSTLNPNDVESITVLKDAASASIYGSRAANGVILVTTKKGKAGKTKIRFDSEVGTIDIAYQNEKYRPLTAPEYIAITTEGLVNSGASQATITSTMNSRGATSGIDYNWLDAVIQQGSQQQYNLSASGGTDKSTFYMSGGYFKQQGTIIKSDLDRFNGSMRLTNKATDRLTLNMNINGGFVRQRTPLAGGAFGNPVLSSYFVLPTRTPYKTDGTFNILTPEFPASSLYNTVAVSNMDKRYLKELSIRGSVSAEYTIITDLKFRTAFGADYSSLEEDQYNNPLYGDGAVLATGSPTSGNVVYNPTTTGRVFSGYTRYFNWTWTNTLTYHRDILKSGDLSFNLQAGYESQLNKNYFTTLQSRGFSTSPTLYLQYPSSGATPSTTTGAISDYSFASIFGNGDINYKNKYVVSGSFRRDGSSRFGANNKYGNFWSIGGSWNVDKEDFISGVSWISQLKLRASYGVNGNAGIGNYDWFPSYAFNVTYNSAPGSAPSNVGNLDLTWELNKPLNIGIDLGMFQDRLAITFDWYKRKSEDLLLNVPLSRTSGFSSQSRNIGSLENKGIELTINAIPVRTRDFTWTINLNYARNKNRVLSIPSPIIGTFLVKDGYDIQTFYSRVYAGVDPANGDPLWYSDSTRKSTTNNYSAAQRVPYGSASPKYFGAFTTTFNYKGITLEAQFNYQAGNLVQDVWGSYYLGAGFNAGFNKVLRVMDRWQKAGDATDIPKYIEGGNKSFQSFSTFYLAKGDFIRMRNVQLGYEFPKQLLSKMKISSLFFYVRGTNLWTWVKDKHLGWDPEQGVASQTNLEVYIPKTTTVGVNLGF